VREKFSFLSLSLLCRNKRHHHQIQKIKIAQTMNITKHNNKNGTTMRRSKKLFLHRCCNSVVLFKKYDDDEENVCMHV
jgi:hypothetical protein